MALGASWWSTDWRDFCLPGVTTFDDASIYQTAISTRWQYVVLYDITMLYQRQFGYRDNTSVVDGGMFYCRNDNTDELTPAVEVFRFPRASGVETFMPAPEYQDEIEPFDESSGVRFSSPYAVGPTAGDYSDYAFVITGTPNAEAGDTFSLEHHGAWAWRGSPSQVIAAILLRLGVASTWIDTVAVDNAYDGEGNDHGPSGIDTPRIMVSRTAGRPIIDTIKRIAAHAWTRVGYTMDGLLACWSATRPTEYAATGLIGIKDRVSWRMIDDHLYNYAEATHGQVCRTTIGGSGRAPTIESGGVEVTNPDYKFRAVWDPTLSGARSDRWTDSDGDATSQSVYGVIALGSVGEDGKPAPVHYELFQDGTGIYGSTNGVLARVDKFCQPLREVQLIQDLRGLDYEVGTLVTDLVIGGETFDAFCISKEIDFNTLTVTSVLLEDL